MKPYFYRINDQQIGPVYPKDMIGKVSLDTYVWCEGMENWTLIKNLPELATELNLVAIPQNSTQNTIPPNLPNYQNNNTNGYGVKPPRPKNYLALSIVAVLLCQILGIIAIVYSSKVDTDYNLGNYKDAIKHSKTAKTLGIISIVSVVVFLALYIAIFVFAFAFNINHY